MSLTKEQSLLVEIVKNSYISTMRGINKESSLPEIKEGMTFNEIKDLFKNEIRAKIKEIVKE